MIDSDMNGEDKFKLAHPDTFWQSGLEHAVKIGLGNTEYELITVYIERYSDCLCINLYNLS